MDARPIESVTVAFQLAVLERVSAPNAVFEQTNGWASHVGILSDRPTHVITEFARRNGLDIGFHSGSRTLVGSLPRVRAQPELAADRYILIGNDEVDREAASASGWEFLHLEDAAEAAGWGIRSESDHTDEDTSWI